MRFSWGFFYFAFWIYRCVYSVMAEVVIARLTPLGDAPTYQGSGIPLLVSPPNLSLIFYAPRQVATDFALTVGGLFSRITGGNAISIDIGFQTIAFAGIVAFLAALPSRVRGWAALLLMLPSFSIWSSVAGKEALVVFSVGILGAFVVRFFRREARFRFWEVVALFILVTMKPQYIPAFAFLGFGLLVGRYIRQKSALTLAGGIASLFLMFSFRHWISKQSFLVAKNFSLGAGIDGLAGGRSTRPPFWLKEYDVFWKAPEGMLKSFLGPTLAESQTSILQAFSFAESTIVVGVLLLIVLRRIPGLPLYMVLVGGFTLFWLLFATYPFGVMNPGSAVRYRTGYEIIVFLLVLFVFSRSHYEIWRATRAGRRRPAPAADPPQSEFGVIEGRA